MRPALVGALVLAMAAPAAAAPRAKTRFDDIRDCERLAAREFRERDPAFRRFAIDRNRVLVDPYARKVGTAYVANVYHGRATYDAGKGAHPVRFVCLHGGANGDALFVWKLPQ